MAIRIGPDIVIGRRGIRLSGGGGAVDWWLSGGISAANAIAVYQPIGAASLAASYVNLANPGTYDAAPGTAPTFDAATGWTFNGSTQYLTTGVVPATNQVWSMIVRFSDVGAVSFSALCGSLRIVDQFMLQPNTTSGRRYMHGGNTSTLAVATPVTSGVMAFAGRNAYYNGAAESSQIPAATATTMVAIYIGAYNSDGTPTGFRSAKIQAVAIYNTTLTADQVAAVSTAMAAM